MGSGRWFDRKKILAIINKDSFYIVLFLCLVLLATTAVWVTQSNIRYFSQKDIFPEDITLDEEYKVEEVPLQEEEATALEKSQQKEEQQQAQEVSKQEIKKEEEQPEKVQTEQAAAKENSKPVKKAAPQAKKTTPVEEKMILPVLGKVIVDYSKDNLVYSKTLEHWTTHYGIDIAADIGTPVKAAMSGTITDISRDPKLGIMITIDHGNGLVTRYASLQTDSMVKKGQKVKRGQVISAVGNTADFEVADPPHLHFEVLKNGQYQDPKLYLPNM